MTAPDMVRIRSFPFELEATHRSAFAKRGNRNFEISINRFMPFPGLVVDEKLHAVSLRMAVRTFRPGFLGCFGARAESQRTRVRANHFGPIPLQERFGSSVTLFYRLVFPSLTKIGAKAPIFKSYDLFR